MTSAQVCILISIAVYLIAMLAIGIVCSKRNNTVDDFYLGGRRLGPVVTAMSAEASDMSSWLLMGLPGVAYLTGIADPGWTAIGLGVGTYINWLVVARRLRRYSARIGAITVPDFFSRRFGEKKHILTAMAAILIIVFFVPYTASGFAACGKLFGTLFGMDYHVAMIISAIVIVGYTATGGFTAASTTDLVQSIVMSIALVVVLVFGVSKAGGVGAVVENAQSMSGYLSMTATYDPESGKSATYNLLKILSTAAWGLGYFGMPHILLRFMAIEDDRKLKTSRRIATIWVVISMFNLNLSAKAKMIVARVTLLGIAVVGIFMAWDSNASVFKIVSFAWAGFGASFGPVMLLALFWRRSNRYGAVAGMIAGAVMVFLWKYCIADLAPVLKIYELLPAFLFGLLVNVVVSLCTPAPDKEVLEQYDAVKAEK